MVNTLILLDGALKGLDSLFYILGCSLLAGVFFPILAWKERNILTQILGLASSLVIGALACFFTFFETYGGSNPMASFAMFLWGWTGLALFMTFYPKKKKGVHIESNYVREFREKEQNAAPSKD
ncbi:hypothetical protein [Pontibacter burrus]|uniref:Uncharacterized protein n=1 Tax=Pontibacter burrus TaxID=2704466 RepID=A0A6B3LS75_9BACT|nr:hypothetical protein [Pontibacter burrus]NEM99682.1 hypothetical protein [Pontibacter burrus]